ncbi:MAG: M16 family metallopeptidase [Hyphomicrobiaceae bacterium]
MPTRVLPFRLTILVVFLMLALLQQSRPSAAAKVERFELANGLVGVVVPDNRAPVVTHMVWYRIGAADEPPGKSGIAHFLEHLMFKATEKLKSGEFSKIVSRIGGNDNAFTSHDATAYFQRVSRDRLGQVMEMEADRMVNLRLAEKEVLTERNVILEERRMRVDNNPSAILDEQMSAALYRNHPYGVPVIGWEHEMAQLSRADALNFYKAYYAPNNAILVVAGDVTVEEVKALAEKTYGKLKPSSAIKPRQRPQEPPQVAAVRVELKDPRAGKPVLQRQYIVPSYVTAAPGEAEALDLLMQVVGGGPTSRLYKKLVVEDHLASSAGGYYGGSGLDTSKIAVYGVPTDGVSLDRLEAGIDKVLEEVIAKGVTEAELNRAKSNYIAQYVYESDSQSQLARRYGWGLVVGRTIESIDAWPDEIAKVTPADVQRVARKYLNIRRSVTGTLLPEAPKSTADNSDAPDKKAAAKPHRS